jgi:hypothetical protein
MSGGSYEYLYSRVQGFAEDCVVPVQTPLRRAFAAHLLKVAEAMHDVEWVDSGDYEEGGADEAMREVLAAGAELEAAKAGARLAIDQLVNALANA